MLTENQIFYYMIEKHNLPERYIFIRNFIIVFHRRVMFPFRSKIHPP